MRKTIKYIEKVVKPCTQEDIEQGKVLDWEYDEECGFVCTEEIEKETPPTFFEIPEYMIVQDYGYSGPNDVREILDWFNEKYGLDYTYDIIGDTLKSRIIFNDIYVSELVGLSTGWKDKRCKWVHLKMIASEFTYFLRPDNDIASVENFYKNIEERK